MDHQRNIVTPAAKKFVFSRGLPKTGQTIAYIGYDDGAHEFGWSMGTRFIEKTISGDEVIFDRATGLLWPKRGNSSICNNGNALTWANAVLYPADKVFAGKMNWRLPNRNQMLSIVDHESLTNMYPEFTNPPVVESHWTSTTDIRATWMAYRVNFGAHANSLRDTKTKTFCIRPVRVRVY